MSSRAAALLLLAGGCHLCDAGTRTSWMYDALYAGSVSAPVALKLPAAIDESRECGQNGIVECMQGAPCDPAFCLQTVSQDASLVLHVDPPLLAAPSQSFTLPSSEVAVQAYIRVISTDALIPLAVQGGLLDISLPGAGFDARIALDLETQDRQQVTVEGGRYALLNGHHETSCAD